MGDKGGPGPGFDLHHQLHHHRIGMTHLGLALAA